MRPSTEWVDTVEAGANVLVDDDPDAIAAAVAAARFPADAPRALRRRARERAHRSRSVRLTRRDRAFTCDVAIIGAGYVGLPLASDLRRRRAARADRRRRAAARRRDQRRRQPHRGRRLRAPGAARRRRADHRDGRLRASCRTPHAILIALPTPLTKQREPDLCYVESAAAQPRAGPPARPGRRARVDDLSRARRARSCSRSSSRAAGLTPARTSTSRCRPSASTRAAPTGRRRRRRRSSAGSPRPAPRRPRPSTASAIDTVHEALGARVGRADEAAREHLPLGQHRARQRARAALRPDGHRRLGGGRGGRDEAVRLPVVPARARASAATASRSTPTTSPGRRASTTSRRASSSSPARSTTTCRTSAAR